MKTQLSRFTRCGKCHEGNTIMKTDRAASREKRLPPELFTHNLTLAHMKQPRKRFRLAWSIALLVRYALVALVGITVFSAVNIVYALPVSERTPQVRDAIVAAVPGVNSANDVTEAHLAAITGIDITPGSSVKAGDFDGLTGLTTFGLDFRNDCLLKCQHIFRLYYKGKR